MLTSPTIRWRQPLSEILNSSEIGFGGDRRVMDICIATDRCLSQTQAVEARLTRLEIAPGQSHTIYWDLPMSDVDLREVRSSTNVVAVVAKWLDSDGVISDIDISFSYGPRILLP